MRVEMRLAEADAFGRNLDHFIVVDSGDGFFQRHHPGRGAAEGIVFAGGRAGLPPQHAKKEADLVGWSAS